MTTAAQKARPKAAPATPEIRRAGTQASAAPRYLRASLQVGGTHDPEEHEAEHAARIVASGGRYHVHDPGGSTHLRAVTDPGASGRVRRAIAPPVVDPGASGRIRRAPAAAIRAKRDEMAANRVEAARASAGRPLSPVMRARLEHGFGHDLHDVRIHTGPAAHVAAASIGARAYTEGNRITLGAGESEHDLHLMAHEATHVVQNRAPAGPEAARRTTPEPVRKADAKIRRFGIDDVLDWLADKANNIPGYRMFTIVLGVNPINMSSVDRSAANILRALVEFIPGGHLIVQALDTYGVFEKAGNWVSQQIDTLGMTGAAIGHAVSEFIDSLHWRDALHPGDVWDRAKRIFTDPIDRIIDFVKGVVDGIIQFVKDAVLRPLAALAAKTRAWDLLIAILGKNPITGDPVPQTAETLIGGFMKLIGQEEVWQNMQKAHAVSRAFAWFKNAMATLIGFAMELPGLFLAALKSFSISDLLDLPGAIGRVLGMFGDFVGRFISWALDAVWNLLEIIFDSVSPGAWGYIKKTGAALKSILKNPLPFVRNLVRAAKLGLSNFADNIGTHLKNGLIDWLTGSLTGVYIPKALSLIELGKFALSILGVTWAQIRGKIVKALGAVGEKVMQGLEKSFDVVKALATGGPEAAWEIIKEKLTGLKDMVMGGIVGFVTDTIVKKAIPKLVSMFVPGAGFISAILSIYDTVMVFVHKLSKIAAAVAAFIDSIVAIAAGMVGGAAQKVESVLASLLSLAISFLAGFLGLGNITSKIMGVIEKVRARVDEAIETAIAWIVGKAKAFGNFAVGLGRSTVGAARSAAAALGLIPDKTVATERGTHRMFVAPVGGRPMLKMQSVEMTAGEFLRVAEADPAIPAAQKTRIPDGRALVATIDTAVFHHDSEVLPVRRENYLRIITRSQEDLSLILQAILRNVPITAFDERYLLEGFVGTYGSLAGLQSRDRMTPDHMPQAAVLKYVAGLPLFAAPNGVNIRAATGGAHAEGAQAINIHEVRHRLGRTFGTAGRATLNAAIPRINSALARNPTDPARQRSAIVQVLREDLADDVGAMRSVVGGPLASPAWADLNALVAAGSLTPAQAATLKDRIQNQVDGGLSRMAGQSVGRYQD